MKGKKVAKKRNRGIPGWEAGDHQLVHDAYVAFFRRRGINVGNGLKTHFRNCRFAKGFGADSEGGFLRPLKGGK